MCSFLREKNSDHPLPNLLKCGTDHSADLTGFKLFFSPPPVLPIDSNFSLMTLDLLLLLYIHYRAVNCEHNPTSFFLVTFHSLISQILSFARRFRIRTYSNGHKSHNGVTFKVVSTAFNVI